MNRPPKLPEPVAVRAVSSAVAGQDARRQWPSSTFGDFEHCVIMKPVVLIFSLIAVTCVGCPTHHSSRRLESTTSVVLAAHHFAPPRFVTGSDGVIWAVASRPRSDSAVETACIRLDSDGRASAEVTSYQYVGSDWAMVGRLFDQARSQQEAAEIEQGIEHSLKER